MPTFDIWLEDSQGRQFRRSNHYQHTDFDNPQGYGDLAIFQVYQRMACALNMTLAIKRVFYAY